MSSRDKFYQIMDKVDQYDTALTSMSVSFTEAMLSLSYIKFINPYTSISVAGYKPTPALRTYCEENNSTVFEGGCFGGVSHEDVFEEEERQSIQQDVKMLMLRDQLSQSQKILNRFGAMNNRQAIIASQKFTECLHKILNVLKVRNNIIKYFDQIQSKQSKCENKQINDESKNCEGNSNKRNQNNQPVIVTQ